MPASTIKIVRYFLGLYLIVGGTISLYFILTRLGVTGFLYNLIPATITTLIVLFFILSGYKYAFLISKSGEMMMKISLWIQAIQLMLFGMVFKNYFGPYLAIGFTDTPELKFQILIEPLTSWFANGLNKLSDEVSIVFNLIAIILLILVYRIELAETKLNAEFNGIDIKSER